MRAFWSLNEDILKITVLKTNTPYPSRNIWRIRACTHQRPQKIKDQYAKISNVVSTPRNPQYAVSNTWIRLEYGISTSTGYFVSSSLSNTAYSIQLINTAYPLPLDTAYRLSCMTRRSTNELYTPYKGPECEFRSSRRHFKTLRLDELRSPDFNLLSDEEYSEEEEEEMVEI
ncbi:hypothetical protein Tco_1412836, partial [Tanacetum coccineum]